jgi:Rap1a immunity proteins
LNRNASAAAAPLLAALLLAGGPPALAQQAQAPGHVTNVQTVSDLAAVCDPRIGGVPRLESIAYCQGYFTAAGQYHTALHPAGGPRRPLYCLPNPPPTVAQSALAFAAWARQNPQHANEPALDGLFRWAQATYPCPARGDAASAQRPAAARPGHQAR